MYMESLFCRMEAANTFLWKEKKTNNQEKVTEVIPKRLTKDCKEFEKQINQKVT